VAVEDVVAFATFQLIVSRPAREVVIPIATIEFVVT